MYDNNQPVRYSRPADLWPIDEAAARALHIPLEKLRDLIALGSIVPVMWNGAPMLDYAKHIQHGLSSSQMQAIRRLDKEKKPVEVSTDERVAGRSYLNYGQAAHVLGRKLGRQVSADTIKHFCDTGEIKTVRDADGRVWIWDRQLWLALRTRFRALWEYQDEQAAEKRQQARDLRLTEEDLDEAAIRGRARLAKADAELARLRGSSL